MFLLCFFLDELVDGKELDVGCCMLLEVWKSGSLEDIFVVRRCQKDPRH